MCIYDVVIGMRTRQPSQFVLVDDLLYWRGGQAAIQASANPQLTPALRLYIPAGQRLRQSLIAEHHDVPFCGHLGRDKTMARLQKLFYWPQMEDHVHEYLNTCPSCQMQPKQACCTACPSLPTLGSTWAWTLSWASPRLPLATHASLHVHAPSLK